MRFLPARVIRVWQGSEVDQLVEVGYASRNTDGSAAQFSEFPNRDVMAAVLATKTPKLESSSVAEAPDLAQSPAGSRTASWIFVPIAGASAVHGLCFL